MKFFSRIIFYFFVNLVGLLLASNFVPGFVVSSIYGLFIATAILTLINIFLKPIIKFIFGPVIVLTLGIGIIAVNALLLWLLDYLSVDVNIIGIQPLIYATLILSVVNMILTFSGRRLFKTE